MRITPGLKTAIKASLASVPHGHVSGAIKPALPTEGIELTYRGKRYLLTACTGEAHSNAYIDHCGLCMPLWGVCVEGPL